MLNDEEPRYRRSSTGPELLTAFDLTVLRSVGFAERPAMEVTIRLLDLTPEVRGDLARGLLGSEVWLSLQKMTARGILSFREGPSLFPRLKNARKLYRVTLSGLDELERAETDAIMTRVSEETPPAPDTQPMLPGDADR